MCKWRIWDPGSIACIHGIMDYGKYQEILNPNLVAFAKNLKLRHGLENSPKHTLKSTLIWLNSSPSALT